MKYWVSNVVQNVSRLLFTKKKVIRENNKYSTVRELLSLERFPMLSKTSIKTEKEKLKAKALDSQRTWVQIAALSLAT